MLQKEHSSPIMHPDTRVIMIVEVSISLILHLALDSHWLRFKKPRSLVYLKILIPITAQELDFCWKLPHSTTENCLSIQLRIFIPYSTTATPYRSFCIVLPNISRDIIQTNKKLNDYCFCFFLICKEKGLYQQHICPGNEAMLLITSLGLPS